jgi:uncharacterized phage protein (TIGR01671 family)
MREIKFRVWDSKEAEMVLDPQATEILLRHNMGSYNKPNSAYKPEELIVMQYTGLKDKNGKEIYEGDVCKDSEEHTIGRIKSHPGYFSFMGCVMGIDMLDQGNIKLEVIGNIYENPELL